jgi:hypothetical protein
VRGSKRKESPWILTARNGNTGVRVDNAEILRWVEQLKVEHRDLDEVIHHLIDSKHHDLMRIQRLKKRKLKIKDMIAKLESGLIPDLDA